MNSKLQLLFLQADAKSSEEIFVKSIIEILTPSYSFDSKIAIGTTDKLVYRKGEKLKLSAVLVEYCPVKNGYIIINGKRIETSDGAFHYSKKITEKLGVYKLYFEVFIRKNGKFEVYPCAVTYKVE